MPILTNYRQFSGRHYETGSIHNVLAYQGTMNPVTGEPISEALLLGISGGIAFGYFTFAYKGFDPHVALLTRNTFNPLETILERLVIPRDVIQSTNARAAEEKLIEALEGGDPALVWADMFSLPYKGLSVRTDNWAMLPVVVYGLDDKKVYIADGSQRPFIVGREQFTQARERVKKERYRFMTLDAPYLEQLPVAVQKGIWQCINLYTEMPPKGSKNNFGFAAYQHLARMLTNTRNKQSWERVFPTGSAFYMALVGDAYQPGAYGWINTWGTNPGADRSTYADFLDEAALILDKPELKEVGNQFRKAAVAWCDFAITLLPDDIPLLKESRELKQRKHDLFWTQGQDALNEILAIHQRFKEIRAIVTDDFPMSAAELTHFRKNLQEQVLNIHDLEKQAIADLQLAMNH